MSCYLNGAGPFFDDDIDLTEALGLPDQLPPQRLPSADELAMAARDTAFSVG
jgi:hypothetical protein